jgi:hypothetical protein
MSADLATLTAEDFEPLLHERFSLGAQFEVELVEVSVSDSPGPSRRQFSLLFRGGPSPPLPQGIHALEHATLGRLELFLVPLGPDRDGQRYEAVFT